MSGASVAAPASPQTLESETHMAASPAENAVQQALQQLSGVGFSSQVRVPRVSCV